HRGSAQGTSADRAGGRHRGQPSLRERADRPRRRDGTGLGVGPRHRGDHPAELAGHPQVTEEIDKAVQAANDRLARVERVKRHTVLAKAWTPESGELTPTLKLKRRVINDRYHDDIEALYGS